MATEIIFNGAARKLPGSYATIVSGEQNAPANLDFGKVLVIDTGLGANWGGGPGIDGTLGINKDSVFTFDNIDDYKNFLKGGLLWKLSEKLFFPFSNSNGVSTIYHVRAATTTPAKITFTATGGGANGGTFKFDVRDEGIIGNGVLTSTHLDKGYAFTIESGVIDPTKWIFKIWRGTWVGDHTDAISYDGVPKADTKELLVVQSPEFNNIQELLNWANVDKDFDAYFAFDGTSSAAGDGSIDAADVAAVAGFQVATGGSETYSSANLDKVFAAIQDLDYQFILVDKYGVDDYDDALVTKIFTHIQATDTEFDKTLIIGAGADESEFVTSLTIASYFASHKAIAVHGNSRETSDLLGSGYRVWPSIYTAATVLGRLCGLPPQIPITNKQLGIDGVSHSLTKIQQERALDGGLLAVVPDQYRGGFKVLQGVNTQQKPDNKVLFNASGNSHSIQFERIKTQINRELIINSEIELLGDDIGVNANTLTEGRLKTWVENYLQTRVATADTDNLLISFRNVTVARDGDNYVVTYGIVLNNEITKIFFTGFLFRS